MEEQNDIEPVQTDEDSSEEAQGKAAQEGKALAKAGATAAQAAAGASRSIAGGFSAMQQVRRAAKQRSDIQADIRDLKRLLETDQNDLAHRRDTERNYPEIVTAQTAEIEKATAEAKEAHAKIKKCEEEIQALKEELRDLKEHNEQKLRPYRNVMESSRGRSDDAAKALANIRRSVRNAETAVNDATKRREQRIAAANKSVDNARERLTAVQNELDTLQADPNLSPSSTALAKVQSELSLEQAHLESARADVVQTTQESQDAVDQAQQRLWTLQRELSVAEKTAADTKREAAQHKDEYDSLYKDSQAKEKAKEDAIKSCEARIKDYKKTRDAARARAKEAKAILTEAEEIHAHPETTQGLRQRIADEEMDLSNAMEELEELTQNERDLRRATRGTRAAFITSVVAVLALIVFLVWFLAFRQE